MGGRLDKHGSYRAKEKDDIHSIVKAMKNPKMRKLIMWNCGVNDEKCRVLSAAFATNTSLVELFLRQNKIGPKGAKHLGEALKLNKHCWELDLSECEIGDEGMKFLSEGLEKNTRLSRLYIYKNKIGDEGMRCLGEALKVNCSLREVVIWSNSFSAEGARHFFKALEVNTGLERVSMFGQKITGAGQLIGEALKTNTKLTELELGHPEFGDEDFAFVAEGLKANTSLRRLRLDRRATTWTGRRHLAMALKANPGVAIEGVEQFSRLSKQLEPLRKQLQEERRKRRDNPEKFPEEEKFEVNDAWFAGFDRNEPDESSISREPKRDPVLVEWNKDIQKLERRVEKAHSYIWDKITFPAVCDLKRFAEGKLKQIAADMRADEAGERKMELTALQEKEESRLELAENRRVIVLDDSLKKYHQTLFRCLVDALLSNHVLFFRLDGVASRKQKVERFLRKLLVSKRVGAGLLVEAVTKFVEKAVANDERFAAVGKQVRKRKDLMWDAVSALGQFVPGGAEEVQHFTELFACQATLGRQAKLKKKTKKVEKTATKDFRSLLKAIMKRKVELPNLSDACVAKTAKAVVGKLKKAERMKKAAENRKAIVKVVKAQIDEVPKTGVTGEFVVGAVKAVAEEVKKIQEEEK